MTYNFWKEGIVVFKPYIDINGLLCITSVQVLNTHMYIYIYPMKNALVFQNINI